MYCTETRDLKIGFDGSVALGVFDSQKSGEYVVALWELFVMFLCIIYIRCDLVTGVFTTIMTQA